MVLSSIDLQFNELTELLTKWREATVEVATLGVPPHITLLYPWREAPLETGDLRQLEQVLANFEPFDLCFDRLGTFEVGVIYLALKDERVPKAIMKNLFAAFPDTPPYGGAFSDPYPHLTIAKCPPEELGRLKNEISTELRLPLEFRITEVVIMEEREDGQWFNRHVIPLQT